MIKVLFKVTHWKSLKVFHKNSELSPIIHFLANIIRSSRPEVFLRKGVLEIHSKFTRGTPMPKCDFNQVALLLILISNVLEVLDNGAI